MSSSCLRQPRRRWRSRRDRRAKKGRDEKSPRLCRRRNRAATEQQFAEALRLVDAGNLTAARPILEKLVASEPTLAAPAIDLGILHAREKRWPEAEASLAEGIRRDPANAVAMNELAAVQREAGRFKDAEATYQRALAADPEHYRTHRNFAVLLDLYLWRPAEALQHFEAYV
jgi:predicted Zn-dependent protease